MEEIDLKELIEMFLEKKFLIIFVVLLFAIIGAVYTKEFITPMYQSSTSLVLVQTGSERNPNENPDSITTTDITLNSKLIDAYKVIANSKIVTNTVIKNLKLNMETEELQKAVTVSSNSEAELIITVEDTNPNSASKIANELAKVFKDKVTEIYKVENLYVLDVAETEYEPCNVNLVKNVVIFAFVGAVLVAGYILLINMLDTTVKTDSDIEKTLDIPVLASIVLTGDGNKKKTKKSKKAKKTRRKSDSDSNIPFSNNVQFFYDNDLESSTGEDNVSIFSYVNKDNLENNNSINHKKKGGRK